MWEYDDQLILFGGFDGKRWLNDMHIFDPSSLVWNQAKVNGNIPPPRQYHTAEVIGDVMYVFGGFSGNFWLNDLVTINLLTLAADKPKVLGDLPSAREGHAMVTKDHFLYLHGGWEGTTIASMYRLDTRTMIWKRLNTTGPALCGHSMTSVGDKLYIFGGFDSVNWVNTLYIYQEGKWTQPPFVGSPIPRGYHSATLVNRFILIYAGYNGEYILGDLVALDTDSLTWSVPDPCSGHFPSARNAHSMSLLGSELFLFGGYNGTRDTNDLHVLETAAFSSLHDDLKIGFNIEKWHDVTLIAKNGRFPVHSIIVKARCPSLYEEILSSTPNYLVRRQSEMIDISFPQTSFKALTLFCEYLYYEISKDHISPEVRDDLLFLAIKYDIERLKMLCFASMLQIDTHFPESTLATDIMMIRQFKELSDLEISVEGRIFNVHKLLLSARCPYFRAMMLSGMRESYATKIDLPDIKADAFQYIIDWIYSDKFSPLFSDSNIEIELGINLLFAANMLDLHSLMRMTEIALEKIIELENVFDLYQVSLALAAKNLKSYTINFILKNYDRLVSHPSYNNISNEAIEEINTFLPKRMKRQVSQIIKAEVSMVKYWNEESKELEGPPVMISGTVIPNLKKKELVIRPQNPSSPADNLPTSNVENAVPPSREFHLKQRKNPKGNQLSKKRRSVSIKANLNSLAAQKTQPYRSVKKINYDTVRTKRYTNLVGIQKLNNRTKSVEDIFAKPDFLLTPSGLSSQKLEFGASHGLTTIKQNLSPRKRTIRAKPSRRKYTMLV